MSVQRESTVVVSAARQRAVLLAQALSFGFRVEMGTEPGRLYGKFWWSLSRPRIDILVSEGEWDTLRECHDAIIVAHAEELMEE